jgi:hypothetical protein
MQASCCTSRWPRFFGLATKESLAGALRKHGGYTLACMVRARRWLRWEWAFYGRRIRVGLILALLFLAAIGFEVGEALLPHNVLNTKLEYEEKSNGLREFRHGVHLPPDTHHN